MAQAMGLETSHSAVRASVTKEELRQRRAVFMTTDMMDTYLASVLGLPKTLCTKDDQTIGPDDQEHFTASLDFDSPSSSTFQAECKGFQQLAAFMARILRQRPSGFCVSIDRPPPQQDNVFVSALGAEIDEWQASLPALSPDKTDSRLLFAQLSIRLLDAATRCMLYRPYINHLARKSSDPGFSFQGYEFGSRCVNAAMQAVWIVDALRSHQVLFASHWTAIYMTAYACSVLAYFVKNAKYRVTIEESLHAAAKAEDLLSFLGRQNATARRCHLVIQNIIERLVASEAQLQ